MLYYKYYLDKHITNALTHIREEPKVPNVLKRKNIMDVLSLVLTVLVLSTGGLFILLINKFTMKNLFWFFVLFISTTFYTLIFIKYLLYPLSIG